MTPLNHTFFRLSATLAAALTLGAGLAGCRGDRSDKPPRQFIPDMDDSPKYKPQAGSEFFGDNRTMRPAVKGTVAYGRWDFDHAAVPDDETGAWARPFKAQRAALLAEDDAVYRGIVNGKYIDLIPIGVDRELLLRGQERFNIYCAVCHGYQGNGQGLAGVRWSGPVPSFHDPKYYLGSGEPDGRGTDGFLFHIAMRGVAGPEGYPLPTDDEATRLKKLAGLKMPAYAHALSERDGWAIVAYIRALQQNVPLDQVPADQRDRLARERQAMPAAAAVPGVQSPTGNATALPPAQPMPNPPGQTPAGTGSGSERRGTENRPAGEPKGDQQSQGGGKP